MSCEMRVQLLSSSLTKLTVAVWPSPCFLCADVGGRALGGVAAVPSLAAAGVIWEMKDRLQNGKQESHLSMLMAQPSVVNWHEMPSAH